jgi:hypothetical protein
VLNKFLVASTSNNSFRILNLETNSVQTETNSNYYSCNNLVFNKTLNVVYGNSQYYGITRFNFDPVSGAFSNYLQKYTGSSNDNELLLYPDDSKIIAPSGYIFNCSGNVQNDLTNYNYLGQGFISAYFSQDNNGINTLFSGGYSYLSSINIYSKDNLEIIGVKEDFWSTPVYMIVEGDVIKVLERNNYGIIAESFSYSDIISGGEMLNTIAKEKYYLPRKLNY